MPHCLNADVAGYVGSVYLYKHSRFLELVREWIASGDTFRQIAALTAAARHRIIYKKDSDHLISQGGQLEMVAFAIIKSFKFSLLCQLLLLNVLF